MKTRIKRMFTRTKNERRNIKEKRVGRKLWKKQIKK